MLDIRGPEPASDPLRIGTFDRSDPLQNAANRKRVSAVELWALGADRSSVEGGSCFAGKGARLLQWFGMLRLFDLVVGKSSTRSGYNSLPSGIR